MNTDPVFLTIAIPTYNRLKYLEELLPKLLAQCRYYPEIEILISDNNSTDGTWSYISNLEKSNNQIRTRINPVNVGGDENFVLCVESAKGKIIWLFGDDEILCEGAVEHVMIALKKNYISLLIVGTGNTTEPKEYRSYQQYLAENKIQAAIEHSLITKNIFRKEIFQCKTAREQSKTNYGHMYAMMESLKKGGVVYTINKPIIKIRLDRAPFENPPSFLWLKHLKYLYYLEVPWQKLVGFYFCYTFKGFVFRQIGKIKIRLVGHKL